MIGQQEGICADRVGNIQMEVDAVLSIASIYMIREIDVRHIIIPNPLIVKKQLIKVLGK
jgi:hypothetical protein